MDKKVVAEMAFREFSGGNPSADSGLQLRDFQKAVESARAYKALMDYYASSDNEGERMVNEAWLKPFNNVPVLFNETTQTYYSELPKQILWLPQGSGLYFISRQQDISRPFFSMSTYGVFVFSQLINLKNDNTIYFRYDNDNIYYISFDPSIKSVFVQLVPLDDDEIPDEFVFEIVELVVNKFLKAKNGGAIMDKITNNNPQI